MKALLVALGAGFGAAARYILDYYVKRWHRFTIPIETLAINVLGSFILGLVVNSRGNLPLIIGTGFAGAFTTWSTLAYEQHQLIKSGKSIHAVIYLIATMALGIGAAGVGIYLTK
jgi:CrcB protein